VLAGADDQLIPREIHAEQAAGIRGAELAIVDDCGHLSSIEQPAKVDAALRRWLARAD
jgi:pimeloyl-ACP methyl ester carboxylesterase